MSMEQGMKAHGKMTYNMDKVKKHGQMARFTKENINKERNTGMEHMHGMMDHNIRENGMKIRLKV